MLLSLNSGLDALRMLSLARGHRTAAWLTGFTQSLLFVLAVGGLFSNLNNPWNVIAYAGGVATGTVLGILIEARLAPGHRLVRIVSSRRGDRHRSHAPRTRLGGDRARRPRPGRDGDTDLVPHPAPRRR